MFAPKYPARVPEIITGGSELSHKRHCNLAARLVIDHFFSLSLSLLRVC